MNEKNNEEVILNEIGPTIALVIASCSKEISLHTAVEISYKIDSTISLYNMVETYKVDNTDNLQNSLINSKGIDNLTEIKTEDLFKERKGDEENLFLCEEKKLSTTDSVVISRYS
ncbi:hypothetical protein GQX74_010465 [Glossina fuscipes]|nr:hypothetical protein GQX74_010465 [Glossina fuscipes]